MLNTKAVLLLPFQLDDYCLCLINIANIYNAYIKYILKYILYMKHIQ